MLVESSQQRNWVDRTSSSELSRRQHDQYERYHGLSIRIKTFCQLHALVADADFTCTALEGSALPTFTGGAAIAVGVGGTATVLELGLEPTYTLAGALLARLAVPTAGAAILFFDTESALGALLARITLGVTGTLRSEFRTP